MAFAAFNQLGSFFLIENRISVFYPASAVAVVCCMRYGWTAALAVILATMATPWSSDAPLWQLAVSGALNAAEGVIPFLVFRAIPSLQADLRNKRSLFVFLLFGTVLNSVVSAVAGNLLLVPHVAGEGLNWRPVFIWWVSDFSAALLLATPVLAFAWPVGGSPGSRKLTAARTLANAFEVTAVIIILGWMASTAIRSGIVDDLESELVARQRSWGTAAATVARMQETALTTDTQLLVRQMESESVTRFLQEASPASRAAAAAVRKAIARKDAGAVQQTLDAFRASLESEAQLRSHEFDGRRRRIRRVSLLMDLTVLPILLLAAIYLIRSVSRPLVQMHRGIRSVAGGDPFDASDVHTSIIEIDALARALEETSHTLHEREGELIAETEKAVEASRHKTEFLAKMSHELRTPLNSIVGFTELLLDQGDAVSPEKRRAFLTNVWNSGNHLLGLITDLLDLARLEAGKMRFEFVPVDVRQIVVSSVAAISGMAEQKGLEIRYELSLERLTVEADSLRIEQVLLNLLSNACKFSREGGRIVIDARREGDLCVIDVSDDGIGIADADQQRIFEEFEQVQSPVSSQGTGLGLALVRYFVTAHRGTVSVESAAGRGSRFRVTLPLAGVSS